MPLTTRTRENAQTFAVKLARLKPSDRCSTIDFATKKIANSCKSQLQTILLLITLFFLFCFSPETNASPQAQQHQLRKDQTKDASANDLPGTAKFIRDEKNITIIEFDGNYDIGLSNPRKTLAKEFFRTHADVYDFLVIFTSFEFSTAIDQDGRKANALAFYNPVRNDTSGIGISQFDNSKEFGSDRVLQGYIDMAATSRTASSTADPDYDEMLSAFVHEVQHRWGARVKFRDWNGQVSNALLGSAGSHWSYLLDTQGSVMYGARWRDNGDGTFTAVQTRSTYSPLDQYLAGLIDKSKVPPFFLIESPEIDGKQLPPALNTTIRGTKRVVTIDDIIAAEGPRLPSADTSQKTFRFGFIYVVRPGEDVDPAKLNVAAQARRQVGIRYNALTNGLATANVFAEPAHAVTPSLPVSILPPDAAVPTNPGSNASGLSWLKIQQKADGSFMDATGLAVRDTLLARAYLLAADPTFSGLNASKVWIANQNLSNTDFLARRLIEGTANERRAEDVSALLEKRNPDGGWGLGGNLNSNPMDTALAIQALRSVNTGQDVLEPAKRLLLNWQNADGGWGNASTSPSRVNVSSQVFKALLGLSGVELALGKAKLFLQSKQNFDGGFGDGASSIHDTANAALALTNAGLGSEIDLSAALRFVSERQRIDGSWQGSVYNTVLAMQLLRGVASANLAIGGLKAAPLPISDGQRVNLSATVTNLGSIQSQATTVRFFDGDPVAGGTAIGNAIPIPALVGGDHITVPVSWNTTSRAGHRTVFAVVDLEQVTADLSRQDNTTSLPVVVESANSLADVLLTDEDVLATPSSVSGLPTTIQIDALVTNAGLASVNNAKAILWSGVGKNRTQVAETTFSVAARATTALRFTTTMTDAGNTVYTVELDPEGLLSEASRANNSGAVTIKIEGGVSLFVNQSDISQTPDTPRPGEDVVFTARLHNSGTLDSASFNVRYSIRSSSGTNVLRTNVVQIAAGDTATQQIPWRASQGGDYSFIVEMDPEGGSGDNSLTDNTATLDFTVAATAGLNLAVSYKDLIFTPTPALEGSGATLSALVRNVGDTPASSFNVEFYDGDPRSGGVSIGSTSIASLIAGASATATVNWEIPTDAERLIFAVVDPSHTQSGETTLEDNIAFASLKVLSLPDFAISRGALTLNPSVPKPDEATTLQVTVSNLGEQGAKDVIVSAFLGDQAGGIKLAPDAVVPALASKANASVTFSFNAPAASNLTKVTVVVNPQFVIKERLRDNNIAAVPLGTQDGDFAVSHAFISPNGDGIKDQTVLTYRLPAVMPVSVQVTDEQGRVLRNSGVIAADSAGSWEWVGLDDSGRLVQDGKYELVVRNADGVILGGATVEVDTNRSSLLAAMGTPLGINTGLTCVLPRAPKTQSIRDGEGFYLDIPTALDPLTDLPAGIYRQDDWGRGLRPILGGLYSNNQTPMQWTTFVANDQGSKIVAYNASLFQTISVGGEGEGKQLILNKKINALIGFSHDDGEVLVTLADNDGLYAIDTRTGAQRDLGVAGLSNIRLSPDKKRLIANPNAGGTIWLDVVSGASKKLPEAGDYYWSPNGVFIAGKKEAALLLLNSNGNAYAEIDTKNQTGNEVWSEDSTELYLPTSDGCRVSTDGKHMDCTGTIHRIDLVTGQKVGVRSLTEQRELRALDSGRLTIHLATVPGRYELLANLVYANFQDEANIDLGYRLIDLRSPYPVSDVTFNSAPPVVQTLSINSYDGSLSRFIEYGRGLQYQALDNPAQLSACTTRTLGEPEDTYVFRTLANLQADLVLSRLADGVSVKIHGGVADRNFERYWLDYASDDAPGDWRPIIAANSSVVWYKDLAVWVTPGVGRYTVRLTAEDLAGNQIQKLRRITIAQSGPPITNVVREPAQISPNGDGNLDEMTLSYRVLEPVNLEFSIFNRQGALVRSISRSHPVAGVNSAIIWDGRDDNGQVVIDGEYRVNVVGFDFFVHVDNTSPRIQALQSGAPFTHCPNAACRSTELRWSVADTNFDSVQLEVGEGNAPTKWHPYGGKRRIADNLKDGAIYLPLADYTGQRFRLTAVDLAGNRTVAEFEPAQESAKLILAGQILDHDLADGEIPPTPVSNVILPINADRYELRAAAGIALGFAETLNDPVVSVSVQFNEKTLAQKGEWLEQPNLQVYPFAGHQRVLFRNWEEGVQRVDGVGVIEWSQLGEGVSLPQNYGVVGFFNNSIPVSQETRLRLKLTTRSGEQHFTNEITFLDYNSFGFSSGPLVTTSNLSGAFKLKTTSITEKLEIFVSSEDDPFFAIERRIANIELNSVVPETNFGFGREGRYVSCARYKIRAVVTLATGATYTKTAFASNCGGIEIETRPVFASSCNEAPSHQFNVGVTPQSLAPLLSLEVFAKYPNGGQELIFNVVNPTSDQKYEFIFDHANYQEGSIELVGVSTNRDGEKNSNTITVPIDHTPPALRITYPLENQRVCGAPELHKRGAGLADELVSALRPVAEIEDGAGFAYQLEFLQNDVSTPIFGNTPSILHPDPSEAPSPPINGNILSLLTGEKLVGKRIAGELGPIANISGQVSARVTAYDWSGAQICRQVNFYLDGDVQVGPASVNQRLLSPGTGSVLDSVIVSINPMEPVAVTALVRRVENGTVVSPQNGGVIRKLVTNLSVLTGAHDIVWDGKDDAGNYVADGAYTFDLIYEDGCGNKKHFTSDSTRRSLQVEVDRTPPTLLIDRPLAGDVSTSFLDIFGSVTDKNLRQWVLEYSLDREPDVWMLLASHTGGVDLRKLATLDASLLDGTVTLRLKAVDKVDLSAEIFRSLRIKPGTLLIRKFLTSPDPFSPNGDSRRDALFVLYDVLQPVVLDVTVKRGSVVVRHLLSHALTMPGEHSVAWDGRDDSFALVPDGEYTVEIRAESSTNSANVQIEKSSVLLDVSAPVFTLDSVLRPFMHGSTALIGSITDSALSSYKIYIEGPLPTSRRTLVAEGSENSVKSFLGTLDALGLDDARYRISAVATDAADNGLSFQSAEFELDSKLPVVAFSNPAPGAFASLVRPMDITGMLDDHNLLSAELKINGVSVFSETVASTTAPVVFTFDGGNMADGSYATQLIGTDRAGNVGLANSTINVDNTPPIATITSPIANAAIGSSVAVMGTVSDNNMESWKLELGSGVGQGLESLTVIGRGTTNSIDAELAKLVGLPPDGPATMRLTVLDKGGNTTVFDVPLQIDATPPSAPILEGRREQRNDVRLNWAQANDAKPILGYNIYRNNSKINAQPLSGLEYLDTGLVDGNYAYTVTAVSRSNVESARSNVVNVLIKTAGPIVKISRPITNAAVGGLVSIEGSAYATTNFRAYQVSVGVGSAPTVWTELRTSSLPVQGDVLATWLTKGLVEGDLYTIRLRAEDIEGGVSSTDVKVTIDNQAPTKPIGLQAQLSGTDDVSLSWSANTESDLAGYLLYRDGQLVNQIDPSDSSIRSYLLNDTNYLDKTRPDGTFIYTVVAVDNADNLSSPSDPVNVLVDNRAPQAFIVQPVNGASVDGIVYVRADSKDTDIQSVVFEFKSSTATNWTTAGTSAKPPYSINWNTQALANDTYRLRAVATDMTGHTDLTPVDISVVRKNLQRPSAPSQLTALVDGGQVTLNWTISASSNVRGYYIERIDSQNNITRVNSTPVAVPTFVDIGLADGVYQYRVFAVNSDNNESDPTPSVAAVVYTVKLKQPYTPVVQDASPLKGHTPNITDEVTITVDSESGAQNVQLLAPDTLGAFSADTVLLAKGVNVISAQQIDTAGNRSKTGKARVARGDAPAAPETVTAIANGSVYQATWSASASLDVVGYVVS